MSVVIDPFGAGFSLAEMTQAINLIPNQYGRVGQMGLFRAEPIAQRTVLVESVDGELRLLPAVRPGAPATVGSSSQAQLRSFAVPHIPHNDVILPEELQGRRSLGTQAQDPLVALMTRKLAAMRAKHAQTLEYMRVRALFGVTKDGAGRTIYDWHAEFGTAQKSVDFKFGDANGDMATKCAAVARHIEENLRGEVMTGIHALVSPEFFDKLTAHKSVRDAYMFQQGASPLRDDLRRGFRLGSILYEEYAGAVTLFGGQTERLIPAGEGIAFPLGTQDTFVTYFAPGNFLEAVGTLGLEVYARQIPRQDGSGVDLLTESNPLPMVRRPALTVRLYSSN